MMRMMITMVKILPLNIKSNMNLREQRGQKDLVKCKKKIVITIQKKLIKKTDEEKEECDGSGRTFLTKCRPAGLSSLAPKLNDYQRRAVEEIGFSGMLQLRGFGRISWQRISWFVENFNGASRVLSFEGNRNLVITSDDIHDLFMLPTNEGVSVLRNDDGTKDFLIDFKNRNRIGDNLPVSSVQKMLLEMRDGVDDFKRLFVLYCLSTFLAPTANQLVDLNVMRSLMSVERISSFDWCGYVLEKMCYVIRMFHSSRNLRHLNCCLLVLPLFYFHRFKWQGRVSPTTLPLIQHWDKESIRARLRAELNAGGFGRGEWVEGVYPITKGAPRLEGDLGGVDDRVVDEGDMPVQGPSLEPRVGASREVPASYVVDGRSITFQLPATEQDNEEISRIAKDVSS
ncbi:hypothetical protein C2S51_010943 [Perilla frutescens var. frutescens]|nr:hypothetical protein C2S51_010943 [Perilla frutescens var. frutescens]